MSLSGLGVVAIWHDLLPEAKDAFYQWHAREHMPERADIPGFRRGRRYVALAGTPEYFNLYEADTAELLGGEEYLKRLNSPTPWTREVVASFRNVARGICRVLYSDGVGQGGTIVTLRFDVSDDRALATEAELRQTLLPPLLGRAGIAGVHLCCADDSVSRIETAEKKSRVEGTVIPRWVILVEGVSSGAAEGVAAHLRDELGRLRATEFDQATYRLEHQRCKNAAGDLRPDA